MKTEHISVTMKYCRNGETKPQTTEFAPSDYFDLDEGEYADIDSVPKFFTELEFIEDRKNVIYVSVEIKNSEKNTRRFTETNYYDDGQTLFRTVTDFLGDEITCGERITDILLPPEKGYLRVNDIRRFCLEGLIHKCTFHAIVKTRPDGTQEYESIIQ